MKNQDASAQTSLKSVLAFLCLVFLAMGCQRKQSGNTVEIPLPPKYYQKNTTLSGTFVLKRAVLSITGAEMDPVYQEVGVLRDSEDEMTLPDSWTVEMKVGVRLVQVLAIYENDEEKQVKFMYGDVSAAIDSNTSTLVILLNSVAESFKPAVISGRFITQNTAGIDSGPTGQVHILYQPDSTKPGLVVDRSPIYNGWFTAVGAKNVGLKYVTSTGVLMFDSLRLDNLSGHNFTAANYNWMKVNTPGTVYELQQGTWRKEMGIDSLHGYFSDNPSLLSNRFVCRNNQNGTLGSIANFSLSSSGSPSYLTYSTTAALPNPDVLAIGGNSGISAPYCGTTGLTSPVTKYSTIMHGHIAVDPRQLGASDFDERAGMTGVFTQARSGTDSYTHSDTYSHISIHDNLICGVRTSGTNNLYCWGTNTFGQLGIGTTGAALVSTPTQVTMSSVTKVSAGYDHACALSGSTVSCWGRNQAGGLGLGDSTDRYSPTVVTGSFNDVSVGQYSSCAINASQKLYCWGYNAFGQLGNGSTSSNASPTIIDSSVNYSKVVVGKQMTTCAITSDGALKCWGKNSISLVGNGSTVNQLTPALIDSGTSYIDVFVGTTHACGVTTNNRVKCWGTNSEGTLGVASSALQISTPTFVDTDKLFLSVSGDDSGTCGITTNHELMCWGTGSGLRSDMLQENIRKPAHIFKHQKFSKVAIGTNSVHCAIEGNTGSGKLFCWGPLFNTNMLGTTASIADVNSHIFRKDDGFTNHVYRFTALPGLMVGDSYAGNYFDGAVIYKRNGTTHSDQPVCTSEYLAAKGFTASNNDVHLEPLNRMVSVNFGVTAPTANTTYVICPTRAGQLMPGGAFFEML